MAKTNIDKLIFGGLRLISAALMVLCFTSMKKGETLTTNETIGFSKAEASGIELSDDTTYGINIKELIEAAHETKSMQLKAILSRKGFVSDGKWDDYMSATWKKTVYNTKRAESDTIYVFLTSMTGFVGREVDLIITCKVDEIMNEWVTSIKELGYSIVEEIKEEDYMCLSFSKKNDKGGLIKYDSPSREKTIEVVTNFDPKNEGIGGNLDKYDDKEKFRDEAYEYNFVGKIKGNGDLYVFNMALNIDGIGNTSGYYIVTNGANKRVPIKGALTNWADGKGEIRLLEYDEAKNDHTGYSFQGVLRLKHTERGTYAGYSMSGSYKKAADINWSFEASE